MAIFLRAVISGFGLALGSALYHKAAQKLGFEEPDAKGRRDEERVVNEGSEAGKAQAA